MMGRLILVRKGWYFLHAPPRSQYDVELDYVIQGGGKVVAVAFNTKEGGPLEAIVLRLSAEEALALAHRILDVVREFSRGGDVRIPSGELKARRWSGVVLSQFRIPSGELKATSAAPYTAGSCSNPIRGIESFFTASFTSP